MTKGSRIAFLNSKGGVGKTTSAVNTAVALAEHGHRVLLIDMDAQAHVASHFGLAADEDRCVDAVLQEKARRLDTAIQPSPYPNVDVALSTEKLEDLEKLLLTRNQPLDGLWRALRGLNTYEYVLIDCAPNLGILSRNAMRASDYLIIPTELDKFSVDGMQRLGSRIAEMHDDYGDSCAQVLGVLITKYDRRQAIENRVNYAVLEEAFDGDEVFFKNRIRTDEHCRHAKREHRSVLDVKGSRAAEDYRALAAELLDRVSSAEA